jgi:hypothetical protein
MLALLIAATTLVAVDPPAPAQAPAPAAAKSTASPPTTDPALLAEYNARRAKMADTADAHLEIGLWCEQKGLKGEALLHFAAVLQLDPNREAAWKHLGYKKHQGRWMTDDQIAAEKKEADSQKKADREWEAKLIRWKAALASKAKRGEAEKALAGVNDPRAVPSVWKVFATGRKPDQSRAVLLLGQIPAQTAAPALALLAVYGRTETVRRDAIETLRRRDPRGYAEVWIKLLRDPVKYQVKQVNGPGSPGVVLVEGQQANVRRLYAPPSLQDTQGLTNAGAVVSPTLVVQGYNMPTIHPGVPAGYTPSPLFPGVYMPSNGAVPTISYQQYVANAGAYRELGHPLGLPGTQMDVNANVQQLFQVVRELQAEHPNLAKSIQANVDAAFQAAQQWARTAPPGGTPASVTSNGNATANFFGLSLLQAQMLADWTLSEAQNMAYGAQMQLTDDVARIEALNATIRETNQRAFQALKETTGQDIKDECKAWIDWWQTQKPGYVPQPESDDKPTVTVNVALPYVPSTGPLRVIPYFNAHPQSTTVCVLTAIVNKVPYVPGAFVALANCLAAGTLVATPDGLRAIETLRAGDHILSADEATGTVTAQPVESVHQGPPVPTVRLRVGDETITTTASHPFWDSDRGWTRAGDLRAGDSLMAQGGRVRVGEIVPGESLPVWNLIVSGSHTYFVGRGGLLVHDASYVELPAALPSGTTAPQ